MSEAKIYLGDAVYLQTWGNGVILTTEDGSGVASNTICLEPDVIGNFIKALRFLEKENEEDE